MPAASLLLLRHQAACRLNPVRAENARQDPAAQTSLDRAKNDLCNIALTRNKPDLGSFRHRRATKPKAAVSALPVFRRGMHHLEALTGLRGFAHAVIGRLRYRRAR